MKNTKAPYWVPHSTTQPCYIPSSFDTNIIALRRQAAIQTLDSLEKWKLTLDKKNPNIPYQHNPASTCVNDYGYDLVAFCEKNIRTHTIKLNCLSHIAIAQAPKSYLSHIFLVVTDFNCRLISKTDSITGIGPTGMIFDPTVHDFYFPNLPESISTSFNFSPLQGAEKTIRNAISNTSVEPYNAADWPEIKRLKPYTKPLHTKPYPSAKGARPISLDKNKEGNRLKKRMLAALSALKYFSGTKPIVSTNKPYCALNSDQKYKVNLFVRNRRHVYKHGGVLGVADYSAKLGIGNCQEKSMISYSSLTSSCYLMNDSHVTLVESTEPIDQEGNFHTVIAITDKAINFTHNVTIKKLGEYVCIVDSLTEDWYFPNLSLEKAARYGVINTPDSNEYNGRKALFTLHMREHIMASNNLKKLELPLGDPYFLLDQPSS